MRLAATDALIVVDMQPDFCPGGPLAVPDGDAILPAINRLIPRFGIVVATQDWHPPGHASFASSHPGKQPFDTVTLDYGEQNLWPDHCVQGTPGAELHPGLDVAGVQMTVRKGFRKGVDSYSAFRENDRKTDTGLAGYLRERGGKRVFLTGLAADVCVFFSAMDAKAAGFETVFLNDATAGIDRAGSRARAQQAMDEAGVVRMASDALEG